MVTYTADAVSLLVYLVDALPHAADQAFAEAESGETVMQAPSTALSEVLYSVSRDKDVRGVTLSGTPDDTYRELVDNGPVSVAPVEATVLGEYTRLVEAFSIHNGLIVASHRAQGTDAIVTTDGVIADAGYETVWT